MYKLRKKKKKEVYTDYDFVFESFDEFYKHTSRILVKFYGRYSIAIIPSKGDDVVDFILRSYEYENYNITIYVEPAMVDVISQKYVNVAIDGESSPYDDFLRLLNEKSILIDRKLANILYSSISHDVNEMDMVLQSIVDTFGMQVEITQQMLSSKVVLTDIVYPRQVLLEYLKMSKWREAKLNKCLDFMSNNVVLYATINNIKSMLEQKTKFYTTGIKVNKQLDNIWIDNLVALYNVFVIERKNIQDVVLLYKMYEGGVCPYDVLYNEED